MAQMGELILSIPPDSADRCVASMTDKLSKLSPDILDYGTVCIYKVPEKHRNKNQEAYTPKLVSIGLVHHGETQLQDMEQYKLKYMNNFLHIFRISIEDLVQHVDGQEEMLVYACYEENYVGNLLAIGKVPAEVILLDGIFVVKLFLKNYFIELREKGDILFDNPWVSNDILHDLLLFENQLPFRFLNTLYDKFVFNKLGKWLDDGNIHPPSFNELAHKYFKDVGNTRMLSLRPADSQSARHFVEFLSILHKPVARKDSEDYLKLYKVERKWDFSKCPSATRLVAVGVKFKKGKGNCLLDVHFDNKTGVLTVPPLTVNDSTETFFRNLIAFEQVGYNFKYTTSTVIFLDNLIDTAKDVDVLIQHQIIANELGSSQQVADLFNTLYKEFMPDPKEFYFVNECRQLNDYSRHWWHRWLAAVARWLAMLRRDYFSSPWSIISLIAAVIVLGLTAIQTVYSVM